MKFHICCNANEDSLSKEVESYLKKGYKLHGQIFIKTSIYYPTIEYIHQAVVKEGK